MRDGRMVPLAAMDFAQRRLVLSLLEAQRAATAKSERDLGARVMTARSCSSVQAVHRATLDLALQSEEDAEPPVAPHLSGRVSGTAIRTNALGGAG